MQSHLDIICGECVLRMTLSEISHSLSTPLYKQLNCVYLYIIILFPGIQVASATYPSTGTDTAVFVSVARPTYDKVTAFCAI